MLPKLTYKTELGAWLLSQDMQLVSSLSKLPGDDGANLCKGPTGKIGMLHCCCSCDSDDCSMQFMVFQMTALDVLTLYILGINCKKFSGSPNWEKGRSLNRRG